MKYAAGAERCFTRLCQRRHWCNLEELELSGLATDAQTLLTVLSSLSCLKALSMSRLSALEDNVMLSDTQPACFPPMSKLTLRDSPKIFLNGLMGYVTRPDVSEMLSSLTLSNTGVHPSLLYAVLASCPGLRSLHIVETINRPFPITTVPQLASRSLRILKYEISASSPRQRGVSSPADSYYNYLVSSIVHQALPGLRHLYALSEKLPFMFSSKLAPRVPNERLNNDLQGDYQLDHTLSLYTKSVSELEWNLTIIGPLSGGGHGSPAALATRPLSLIHPPPVSPNWRDKSRQSVMVGNGFGGFLMVPEQDGGPISPGMKGPRKERDAWMG